MLPLFAKIVVLVIFAVGFVLVCRSVLSERDDFADLREIEDERHNEQLDVLHAKYLELGSTDFSDYSAALRCEHQLHAQRLQSIRDMANDAAQRELLGYSARTRKP